MHPHHLNCVLLDPGSGCASPLSIDGVAFGVGTWSTSRFSKVQVRQTVLDRYIDDDLPQLCVQARMYYIEAKVHAKPLPPPFPFWTFTLGSSICSWYARTKPNTHSPSQWFHWWFAQCTTHVSITHRHILIHFQIDWTCETTLPISVLDSNPTKIDCSGRVFAIEEATNSFMVTVWQEIMGILPLTPISIRAIMTVKCCKHRPYQCLPNVHTILQFGGDLLTIQNGEAFITAHHHSYFACQYDEVYKLQFWSCFCNVLYITCCYAILMYYLCLAFSGQKIVQRHSRMNPWDHITIHKQGGSCVCTACGPRHSDQTRWN